jgi:hypothetical protein
MTSDMKSLDMADCCGLDSDDLPNDAFPISYTLIDCEQKKDKSLLKWAQTSLCSLKKFHGGGALFAYYVPNIKLSYWQVWQNK